MTLNVHSKPINRLFLLRIIVLCDDIIRLIETDIKCINYEKNITIALCNNDITSLSKQNEKTYKYRRLPCL